MCNSVEFDIIFLDEISKHICDDTDSIFIQIINCFIQEEEWRSHKWWESKHPYQFQYHSLPTAEAFYLSFSMFIRDNGFQLKLIILTHDAQS